MVEKEDVGPMAVVEIGEIGKGKWVVVKVAEYKYGMVVE